MPLQKGPQNNLLLISQSQCEREHAGQKGNLCFVPVFCRGPANEPPGANHHRLECVSCMAWCCLCSSCSQLYWARASVPSTLPITSVPPPACPCMPTALGDLGIVFLIRGLSGWYVQRYKHCVRARLSLEIHCHGCTALLNGLNQSLLCHVSWSLSPAE